MMAFGMCVTLCARPFPMIFVWVKADFNDTWMELIMPLLLQVNTFNTFKVPEREWTVSMKTSCLETVVG